MKTVAVIQARMNSARLPGKVLLPIGDTNAIQMIVDKCKANPLIDEVVVATTENSGKIVKYCLENNIIPWIGDEENVLKRVYDVARVFKADVIVDITSDCPFIDLSELQLYLGPVKGGLVDYASNVMVRTFPDGLDLQVYSFKALEELVRLTHEPAYYQHSGWNFVRQQHRFKTLNIYAEQAVNWPELRITLDTPQDYAVINILKCWLGSKPTPLQIVKFLKQNPSVLEINNTVKAKEPGEL